jgi:hypothetical protein
MGLALKDTQHHCYGDYLTWPEDNRYELIDGSVVAVHGRSRSNQKTQSLRTPWRKRILVGSPDRVLTVYRLINGEYGKPELYELNGETQVGVLPEIVIRWDELIMRLPVDY